MSNKSSLSHQVSRLTSPLEDRLDKVRKNFDAADQHIRAAVESYPVAAAAGALIVGFIFGRSIARR